MITTLITDFSRVLLFPKGTEKVSSLNDLHDSLPDGYNAWNYFELNSKLLDFYASLPLKKYIFTSRIVQEHPDIAPLLSNIFDDVISAKTLGVKKSVPEAYMKLIEHIHTSSDEILYIDDNKDNIIAASKVGLKTIIYENNEQAILLMQELLNT